ncbi:MAG: hypothetical protein GY756_13070 [bacterium]|nr:hypothetical protein [bacterium]
MKKIFLIISVIIVPLMSFSQEKYHTPDSLKIKGYTYIGEIIKITKKKYSARTYNETILFQFNTGIGIDGALFDSGEETGHEFLYELMNTAYITNSSVYIKEEFTEEYLKKNKYILQLAMQPEFFIIRKSEIEKYRKKLIKSHVD